MASGKSCVETEHQSLNRRDYANCVQAYLAVGVVTSQTRSRQFENCKIKNCHIKSLVCYGRISRYALSEMWPLLCVTGGLNSQWFLPGFRKR